MVGLTVAGRGGTWALVRSATSPNAAWPAPSVADVFPERGDSDLPEESIVMEKLKSSSTRLCSIEHGLHEKREVSPPSKDSQPS